VDKDVQTFIGLFTSIFYEALPFIVLGAVIAGVLEEFIPQRWILRLIPRNRVRAIAGGCLLGLLFPMCECGILVILRRLLRKGVPLSVGVAYMLAGPIINIIVMLSTFVAFQGHETITEPGSQRSLLLIGGLGMMSLRAGMGFLVAFGTGLVVEWQYRRHGNQLLASPALAAPADAKADADDNGPTEQLSFPRRLANVTETALHDFVDITVFLILGALLAATARILLSRQDVEDFSRHYPTLAIGAMMGLAVLLCLCSEADAFVAASFTTLRPSAKLAFLVLGPMFDIKLYLMYRFIFSRRLIRIIIGCVVAQVALYSLLVHFVWETVLPALNLP